MPSSDSDSVRVAESAVARQRRNEAQRLRGRHKEGGREEEGRKRGRKGGQRKISEGKEKKGERGGE